MTTDIDKTKETLIAMSGSKLTIDDLDGMELDDVSKALPNCYVNEEFQDRLPFYVANVVIPHNEVTRDTGNCKEWAVVFVPYEDGFLLHDPNVTEETEIKQENIGDFIAALRYEDLVEYAHRAETNDLYYGYAFLKQQTDLRMKAMMDIADEVMKANSQS